MKTCLLLPLATCLLTCITACSDQQIYNAAQQNRQLECQKFPDTRYEDCMAALDTPYDEYERALEATEGTKQPQSQQP